MGRISLGRWPVRACCPGCGVLCSHQVLTRELDGTKRLRCKECGHEWTWQPKPKAVELSSAERMAAKPAREREVRTCPWCGREFVPVRRSQVWCSAHCRDHGRRHQMSAIAGLIAQTERLEREMREVM